MERGHQFCKLSELKGAVAEEVGNKSYNKIFCDNAKLVNSLSNSHVSISFHPGPHMSLYFNSFEGC